MMGDMPMLKNASGQEDCCCKPELDALMKDKTVRDIQQMGSYLNNCALKMDSGLEKSVTMDEYEKRMKQEENVEPTDNPEEEGME